MNGLKEETPRDRLWDNWNSRGGPRYPNEKVVQFTFRHFPASARASTRTLDLGCGSGINSWFLAREGFPVVGTDISSIGLANAGYLLGNADLAGSFVAADAWAQPFPDASFDYILCIRMLELLPEPTQQEELVAECARLLRAGGRAMFLFASPLDYGCQHPEMSYCRFYPPSEQRVAELFGGRFSQVDIDIYQTTYENRKFAEHNFLITTQK